MKEIYEKRFKWFDENCYPDRYLDTYDEKEFSEYVITIGGDVMTRRVYGTSEEDFRCYER